MALLLSLGCEARRPTLGPQPNLPAPPSGPSPDIATPPPAPTEGSADPDVRYTERRARCVRHSAARIPLYGDLHVHTGLSFDANVEEVYAAPEAAYAFARGAPIGLPPLDAQGRPMQVAQLARPLDFAAITDHVEFLGETQLCTTPGSPVYESRICRRVRAGGMRANMRVPRRGTMHAGEPDARHPGICGDDGEACIEAAQQVWRRLRNAAEAAYDRGEDCRFTSLIGFEWTASPRVSNLHRNVIFRNADVPDTLVSAVESDDPATLWGWLDRACNDAEGGCEVLAIPHNSNLSNGRMFHPGWASEGTREDREARARLRNRLEPLLEIFQHKGNSECQPGLGGILGEPDELCAFEQVRQLGASRRVMGHGIIRRRFGLSDSVTDCGEGYSSGGIAGLGCVSRHDFARGALLEGLAIESSLGVNPYRLGFIASTDTHMATPGATSERGYRGHLGYEARLEERLGESLVVGRALGNPGGLTGVWAIENGRDAIFEALARRETFATSGPRIAPRFFVGDDLPMDLCEAGDFVSRADARGTPMGGALEASETPRLRVAALADRDASAEGHGLERLQIVKGWIDAEGRMHTRVVDIAGAEIAAEDSVDDATCAPREVGAPSLCAVWEDPEYDPAERAFYYLRVVQAPTCRWHHAECVAAEGALRRRSHCRRDDLPTHIREMAWTSPVWVTP